MGAVKIFAIGADRGLDCARKAPVVPNDHVRAVLTRQARGHVGRPPTGSPSLRVGDRVGQAVIARIGCFGWWGTLNPRPTHSSLRWGSPRFTYKGQAVDVKQVGRELGVRYVLEGAVRKAGGRVRITGQLIDATNGAHLWADHFDGSIEDVFDLQDKVASSVAGVIEPALQAAETARSARRPTGDLTAYDIYLRAYPTIWSAARQVPEVLRLLEQAIARDPHSGARHGGNVRLSTGN